VGTVAAALCRYTTSMLESALLLDFPLLSNSHVCSTFASSDFHHSGSFMLESRGLHSHEECSVGPMS
jgi:hypothetical protein